MKRYRKLLAVMLCAMTLFCAIPTSVNAIYGNGSIDLSNLEKLTGPASVYALKCGHITNPFNGYSDVGASGSMKADVVFHVYKINETDNWMIIGLLTPSSHTQTGVGLFKVPISVTTPGGGGSGGNDPISLVLQKEDVNTGSVSEGNAAIEGAQYIFKYYEDAMDTDPAASGKSPKYTWVFKTDGGGMIHRGSHYRLCL